MRMTRGTTALPYLKQRVFDAIGSQEDERAQGEYRGEVIFVMNSPEFKALRLEYMQSVLERCDHLANAAYALQTNQNIDLTSLRNEIHKIHGSGGFYGFTQLSERAAVAEDLIMQIRSGEAVRDNFALASLVFALVETARTDATHIGL